MPISFPALIRLNCEIRPILPGILRDFNDGLEELKGAFCVGVKVEEVEEEVEVEEDDFLSGSTAFRDDVADPAMCVAAGVLI